MATASSALERYHDFVSKLAQPGMRPVVLDYLRWRRAVRAAHGRGSEPPAMPRIGPLSINLDLTTACNYACDHCIDWDSLNSPVRHREEELRDSIRELCERGLRSVILIGGGEPTLYPGFAGMVRFLKSRRLQVAVVTNGSRNEAIAEVAPELDEGDWVRLSLDSGSDAVFQAMHRPRGAGIALDDILRSAGAIKERNPAVTLGFSFVIVWREAQRSEVALVENIQEMELAAKRARDAGFDYISFKPYLARATDGAEVLDAETVSRPGRGLLERIDEGLAAARRWEREDFQVIESTNLRVLREGRWEESTRQPRECHMQHLRQVLSPLGVFNCPAHRGVEKARIGPRGAWAGGAAQAVAGTTRVLADFDASRECAEVTCLYNPVNHFLEELVSGGADLETALEKLPDLGDTFL